MIELDAFFYEDNYYLFPGDVDNIDSLVRRIRCSGPDLEVRLLSRENCVPPCFPHSAVRDSVIRDIDARRVFPARVVLMEQDEYDALLRRLLETRGLLHRNPAAGALHRPPHQRGVFGVGQAAHRIRAVLFR